MGGGSSKGGGLKDDAPPPPPPPPPKAGTGEGEKQDEVAKMRKRIVASEKKVMEDQHTKVDEDVTDSSDEGGAYDSDLERQLDADAVALKKQEPEDEHKRLAIQDRARTDALQWTTLVLPPNDFAPADNAEFKPDEEISLDFVHGYRGWDCQGNVNYTVTDEIVYFAGNVGLVLEPNALRQKHYLGPPAKQGLIKELISLAMHPSGAICAMGERSLKASIYIFDLSTMATLREITDAHDGGVSALAFSKDGKRLVSSGLDAAKEVSVWDWKDDKKPAALCKAGLRSPKILALGYNPKDDVIVACGINMIEFMRVGLNRMGQRVLEHLPGVFSVSNRATHNVSPSMLCVAFTKTEFSVASTIQNSVEGLCLTGSDLGNIYLWKREEQIDMIVSAHKSSVYALATFVNGFVSGGKDGKVRVWNNDLEAMRTYDISAAALTEVVIKAIDQRQGRIVLGTSTSCVYELDQDTGEVTSLICGHRDGGVHAVATHPTKPLYASVGDDSVLRFWDLGNRKQWKSKLVEAPGRSVAFSPDGKVVAVGHNLGSWSVHRVDNLDEVISAKDRKKAIFALRYSPNGRYLAVASEDSMVDIYDCVSDYDFLGALQGHAGSVVGLDWALDSTLLMTCGNEQDVMFWSVTTQEIAGSFDDMRDVDWETFTCTIGWPVQGVVGTGIQTTSCCRSLSGHILAAANTDGIMRLFRYPCVVTGAEAGLAGGHTGTISCVRFTFDDTFLVSGSLEDRCVFQWRVSADSDVGFDGMDSGALVQLEQADIGASKKKDLFEQSRIDKRNARMQVCLSVYAYVNHTHTFKGPHTHAGRHTYLHRCLYACMYTYTYINVHAYIRTKIHSYMHAYKHTCIYASLHT